MANRLPDKHLFYKVRPCYSGRFIKKQNGRKSHKLLIFQNLDTKQIMKKKYWIISFLSISILSLFFVLNMQVTTSQGIDYKVSTMKLPLYLKLSNFYDRHFNVKWLARHITGDKETEEEKIFQLFEWTYKTIQPQPKTLPVMDDHVWNVYVRRYGVSDNFHDLFTTLCNYVGANGFFMGVHSEKADDEINLSFIHIKKGWVIFDPFNGVYFTNKSGEWATIDDIKNQNWHMVKLQETELTDNHYIPFMSELPDINEVALKRANIQSPINRMKFQLEKWFSGKKEL